MNHFLLIKGSPGQKGWIGDGGKRREEEGLMKEEREREVGEELWFTWFLFIFF